MESMSDQQSNPVLRGYYPGVIGNLTAMHAQYYADHWNFDVSFEAQVAQESSRFFLNFDPKKDGFWALTLQQQFLGGIAIDGSSCSDARLRWFIMNESFHNQGYGSLLVRNAVDFCKVSEHKMVFLWTFQGLDPARHLYERYGFSLVEEHEIEQWGATITEQKFELRL